jgi:hypothetical protein
LPAAAPLSVSPVTVTVLPTPTLGVSNVAAPGLQLTASLPTTPVSVQLVTVAEVVPSNVLFAAVTVAVTVAALIVAVVTAVVLARL